MGWTSKDFHGESKHTKWTQEDIQDFVDSECRFQKWQILEAHLHTASNKHDHNELWLLVENVETRHRTLFLTLIDIVKKEILWKDMDLTCGPAYHNVPMSMVKQIRPEPTGYGMDWLKKRRKMNPKVKPSPTVEDTQQSLF